MPKPDPALLDPSRYPFTCRIEPRFGDLDVNLHINNVAMASMLEEAHVQFHRANGYRESVARPLKSMVASLAIEYIGEGTYPEPLDFHLALEHLGRTSHTMVQLATQSGRTIAFARKVIVAIGPHGPCAMPASFIEQADPWSLRP